MEETVQELVERQKRLIQVGNELADRALYTSREFDGTHRLASAAAKWIDTVAKLHLPAAKSTNVEGEIDETAAPNLKEDKE